MSGTWLSLGDRHRCPRPGANQIQLARASNGALWICHECGLIWELLDGFWEQHEQTELSPEHKGVS